MTLPWWGWVLLALIPVIGGLGLMTARYRRKVRRRFVAFLQDRRPELEILSVTAWNIAGRDPGGTQWSMALGRLYQAASYAKAPEEEEAVFAEWAATVGDIEALSLHTLSLEEHGDRLRPVLARPEKRRQMTQGGAVPCTALPALRLEILYAVDSEHSLTYITEQLLQELGLDLEGLHTRAMANLRATFPAEVVRGVLAKPTLSVIKLQDGYDATRLLLIPEYLEPGEMIAAMVPDRDTLAFCPADEGFDWNGLPNLGYSGPLHLLKRPVQVTCEGFELK